MATDKSLRVLKGFKRGLFCH